MPYSAILPCVPTPLGSPTGVPKQLLAWHRPVLQCVRGTGVRCRVGTWDGYTGWVYGWVIPVPSPATLLRGAPPTSDRRERALPCRGRVGRKQVRGLRGGGTAPGTTLRARSGYPVPLPVPGPSECRPWANKARFHSFYWKVSQNDEVSPKNVEKAYHSPYFQNRVQKSPLEILRFPFLPAFSCKELIGPF